MEFREERVFRFGVAEHEGASSRNAYQHGGRLRMFFPVSDAAEEATQASAYIQDAVSHPERGWQTVHEPPQLLNIHQVECGARVAAAQLEHSLMIKSPDSSVFCNIRQHQRDADEVFQREEELLKSAGIPPHFAALITTTRCHEHLFYKVVTPSDVGKLNRLVIPKQHAERCFPLDPTLRKKGRFLSFQETFTGKVWWFRYSYWNSSQSYVFTKGWIRFVKENRLKAGDIVSFERGARQDFYISCRKRPRTSSISSLPAAANCCSAAASSSNANNPLLQMFSSQIDPEELAAAADYSSLFAQQDECHEEDDNVTRSTTSSQTRNDPFFSRSDERFNPIKPSMRLFGVDLASPGLNSASSAEST